MDPPGALEQQIRFSTIQPPVTHNILPLERRPVHRLVGALSVLSVFTNQQLYSPEYLQSFECFTKDDRNIFPSNMMISLS